MVNKKIVSSVDLAGIKVGLCIDETIYVSEQISRLCSSDLELMRKHLKVIVMPKDKAGNNRFESIPEWIAYLIVTDRDIFTQGTQEEIDDAVRE